MKKVFFIFGLFAIIACGSKSEVIRSVSPSGTCTLEISGEKGWVDPWNCTIVAEKQGMQPVPAQIEVFQNNLTPDQVKVSWQNNDFASISFDQGSEPPIIYLVRFSESAISIGK